MEIEWNELLDVVVRALLSLVALFLITKMLGKKQVSQLSLFDYVIGISIGNFAAEMTINLDSNEMNGILAVVIFGVIAYAVSFLTMKSIWVRRFFTGTPTILIQDGKLMEKGMRKVKFDVNDLLEQCRGSGYFDLDEIEYAVMEANGKVSILPKTQHRPLTLKDMNLKDSRASLCANIVIDRKIMKQNLEIMGHDEAWLRHQLKVKGYSDLGKILLVTLDETGKLLVYERNDKKKAKNVLE